MFELDFRIMIEKTTLYSNKFHQYWTQFARMMSWDETTAERLYDLLYHAYQEPQRHYHTVQHIVECLELFHQVKTQLDDMVAVELAIWFHDVVYDPQASDNEEQSAQFMQKHCANIVEKEKLEKAAQWIIATKKHQATNDQDLNTLLDIDLAILGSRNARFTEYEQQIQQEYAWVESELYQRKRAEVFNHFYQMKPLYQTEYFRRKFEINAKLNLTARSKQ